MRDRDRPACRIGEIASRDNPKPRGLQNGAALRFVRPDKSCHNRHVRVRAYQGPHEADGNFVTSCDASSSSSPA